MAAPYLFTFADALEHLDNFSQGVGVGANNSVRRMCIRDAYRQIIQERQWSFLEQTRRLQMRAPQKTGTVAFDLTGGANERQLTLTGATWPSWANDASVRLGDPPIVCDVEEVISDTVVTLESTLAPIADITSTTYSLYPRYYVLPNDFVAMHRPMDEESWMLGELRSKEEIEQLNRYEDTTGDIEYYAISSPPDLYGAMALYLHPFASEDETLDIPYVRRPRDLVYTGYDRLIDFAGTVSVTAASASVTGSSTAFESGMAGAILRVGTGTTEPTGLGGTDRYGEQQSIKSVTNATSLTLTANIATTRAGKGYRITDPIDLDIAVFDAFLRCAELRLARVLRDQKAIREAERAYRDALFLAKQGDCRSVHPRVAGHRRHRMSRLADSPVSNRSVVL